MRWLLLLGVLSLAARGAEPSAPAPAESIYARWQNGPRPPGGLAIGVWLQDPRNAERYKAAGFDFYVGLWKGPTEEQLAALKKAGMPVICEQNDVARKHLDDKLILGWLQEDEPDNAQELPGKKGYGPPVLPEKIVAIGKQFAAADATRPVLLNLGQGVAWDGWFGRGVRTNHPEDYPQYLPGGNIVSFDIYPVVHDKPEIAGKLEYVAQGVERLRKWAGQDQLVWNAIECTHISNEKAKATPQQVRAEAWLSIIHGSRGLIFFVHQFKPRFVEAALLEDPPMLAAVTALNKQLHALGPVINSAALNANAVNAETSNADIPLKLMARRHDGALYIFAAALRGGQTTGTFRVPGQKDSAVEVLEEHRTLPLKDGAFSDEFTGYAVHLYRLGK